MTGVSVKIVVPSDRLANGNGSFTGTGWTFGGRANNTPSGHATFTYNYGGALTDPNGVTAPLAVQLPKSALNTAFSATWVATGTSNFVPVQSNVATVNFAAYTALSFGSGPTAARDVGNAILQFLWSLGLITRYLNVSSTIRNYSLAPNQNSRPIYGLTARVSVPTASLVGTGSPEVSGGSWTFGSSTVVGSNRVFTFTHNGTSLAANTTATTANFRFATPYNGAVPISVGVVFEGRYGSASAPVETLSQTATATS